MSHGKRARPAVSFKDFNNVTWNTCKTLNLRQIKTGTTTTSIKQWVSKTGKDFKGSNIDKANKKKGKKKRSSPEKKKSDE
jgi:hypothetical protein